MTSGSPPPARRSPAGVIAHDWERDLVARLAGRYVAAAKGTARLAVATVDHLADPLGRDTHVTGHAQACALHADRAGKLRDQMNTAGTYPELAALLEELADAVHDAADHLAHLARIVAPALPVVPPGPPLPHVAHPRRPT